MIMRDIFERIIDEQKQIEAKLELEGYIDENDSTSVDVKNAKPPSSKFELNLILVFIYMAGLPYGILEKDVLRAAQSNTIGYLTEYKNHLNLSKAQYILRPINVPFKNKWLRDSAEDLNKIDKIDIEGNLTRDIIFNRIF